MVLARAVVRGRHRGSPAEARVDLRVDHDPELGFTAMQRSTGWHAAIVCRLMASGRIEPGARPVELAVDAAEMMSELEARGFELTVTGP